MRMLYLIFQYGLELVLIQRTLIGFEAILKTNFLYRLIFRIKVRPFVRLLYTDYDGIWKGNELIYL